MSPRKTLLFLLISSLSGGCQPQQLSLPELENYVNDPSHGLHQTAQSGAIQVDVIYQPSELLAFRDENSEILSQDSVKNIIRSYENNDYFMFSVSNHGNEILNPKSGFSKYSELLQTVAFSMPNYVRLISSSGDTIAPNNFMLDRTYGMSSGTQMLLSFPRFGPAKKIKIVLQEFGLNSGNMSFDFSVESLRKIPALKMK